MRSVECKATRPAASVQAGEGDGQGTDDTPAVQEQVL